VNNSSPFNITANTPSIDINSENIYDVVIVGAGPVGLATAIGFHERGLENVLVIDQTRAFRPVGRIIDILPNGLKALKLLSYQAYEALINATKQDYEKGAAVGQPKTQPRWSFRDVRGKEIHSLVLSNEYWVQKYGEGRISTSWYGLQTTLRNCLPVNWIQVNHRCVGFDEDPEAGLVYLNCTSQSASGNNPYAHWTEQGQQPQAVTGQIIKDEQMEMTIPARLVIAADGINSTLRRVMYRNKPYEDYAKPHYSGFSAIFCLEIFEVPEALQQELNRRFFQDSPVVTVWGEEVCPEPMVDAAPRIMMVRHLRH